MNKLASKFGSLLLASRTSKGITQQEVAEAASISVRWYQKIESSVRMPGTRTAICLVLYLNLDLECVREEVGLVV